MFNQTELKDYDIDITLIFYSGLSDVFVSFDEDFSSENAIDNYYLSSTINYLLSPLLR